ncbi:MAG: hypothetical protein ACO3JL_15855 [Myxococcota bacterium]
MASHHPATRHLSQSSSDQRAAAAEVGAAVASSCAYTSLMREVTPDDLWGVHAWRVVTAAGAPRVSLDDLLPKA